jgi:hypothetical protein
LISSGKSTVPSPVNSAAYANARSVSVSRFPGREHGGAIENSTLGTRTQPNLPNCVQRP